jgi:hypothetical protein
MSSSGSSSDADESAKRSSRLHSLGRLLLSVEVAVALPL